MADRPAGERTEKPTSRRIRKTRQKGQVAQSQELPSVITLADSVYLYGAEGFILVPNADNRDHF